MRPRILPRAGSRPDQLPEPEYRIDPQVPATRTEPSPAPGTRAQRVRARLAPSSRSEGVEINGRIIRLRRGVAWRPFPSTRSMSWGDLAGQFPALPGAASGPLFPGHLKETPMDPVPRGPSVGPALPNRSGRCRRLGWEGGILPPAGFPSQQLLRGSSRASPAGSSGAARAPFLFPPAVVPAGGMPQVPSPRSARDGGPDLLAISGDGDRLDLA